MRLTNSHRAFKWHFLRHPSQSSSWGMPNCFFDIFLRPIMKRIISGFHPWFSYTASKNPVIGCFFRLFEPVSAIYFSYIRPGWSNQRSKTLSPFGNLEKAFSFSWIQSILARVSESDNRFQHGFPVRPPEPIPARLPSRLVPPAV